MSCPISVFDRVETCEQIFLTTSELISVVGSCDYNAKCDYNLLSQLRFPPVTKCCMITFNWALLPAKLWEVEVPAMDLAVSYR